MQSRKLFLVVLAAVAVLLSASIFTGFHVYKQTVASEHAADVEQSADKLRSELDARLAGHQQTVELAAEAEAVPRHGSAAQRHALAVLVNETAFSGASVIAANGTMTAIVSDLSADRRRELVGSDFGDRRYVQRALAGETYVSDPVAAESGNYIVTVSAPIRSKGEVVGTLNAAFHLESDEFFGAVAADLGSAEGVTVTAADGRVLYEHEPTPDDSLVVQNATLAETGWTVSARESRSVIQPLLRRTTFLQFLSLGAVVVAIAGLGWWNYRRNLRQVERLLDGFESLRVGDYGVEVAIGGTEEWDRIGAGFNEMSATVERSVARNRERNRQLQVLDRLLRHNLRNELNVVRGHAELVLAEASDTTAESAREIIERCDHLLATAEKERTINRVLEADTAPEPVDVAALVRDAVETVRRDYPGATVSLDAPDAARALAVPEIEPALRELVENPLDHTDGDLPTVAVSVAVTADTVTVRVADDGPGIPEIERRVLAGDDDIDALNHSQGLGLWLVHWSVAYSGGSLSFADNDPRGTVVTVELERPDGTEDDGGPGTGPGQESA
jgi:signal transduction histidine kinase